ncbi:glutathione transferase [Malassezia yamatoensis]|uniref:glutathione transferase n=1 Tax=Malassezia yamatoensis TaxID=253288 RepID=A0AAJ6CI82_9BASI|nr:glutathione transferase [Malassezia yamatoensis]
MIIVHHLNNSRSQRILWLLEELGLPYEIKHYKRKSDKLAPKELYDVHPLGKSPVITDTSRNEVVAESGAIIDYIIKYYGKGQGLPSDDNQDADNFWKQFAEASFMPTVVMKFVFMIVPTQAPFFVRPVVSMITNQIQQRFTDPDLKRKVEFSAQALKDRDSTGRTWIAGGDSNGGPTAADYQMLFPFEAITSGRMDANAVPQVIQNWVDWVHARPAYRRAYEKGGPYDYAKL